jgi:hypothetical protein
VTVKLIEDAMKTYIVVEDNGIGIFKKIKNDLSLQDEHQSLLELAKGKFTSNPKEHSGEGIFFSCRACDLFLIHSGSLTYSLDRAQILESLSKQIKILKIIISQLLLC